MTSLPTGLNSSDSLLFSVFSAPEAFSVQPDSVQAPIDVSSSSSSYTSSSSSSLTSEAKNAEMHSRLILAFSYITKNKERLFKKADLRTTFSYCRIISNVNSNKNISVQFEKAINKLSPEDRSSEEIRLRTFNKLKPSFVAENLKNKKYLDDIECLIKEFNTIREKLAQEEEITNNSIRNEQSLLGENSLENQRIENRIYEIAERRFSLERELKDNMNKLESEIRARMRTISSTIIENAKEADQKIDKIAQKECAFCHVKNLSVENLRRCSRCMRVLYCSRECQTQDWKEHKLACLGSEVD